MALRRPPNTFWLGLAAWVVAIAAGFVSARYRASGNGVAVDVCSGIQFTLMSVMLTLMVKNSLHAGDSTGKPARLGPILFSMFAAGFVFGLAVTFFFSALK